LAPCLNQQIKPEEQKSQISLAVPTILGMRLSAPFRKREFITPSLKATKRGLIKPAEVFLKPANND
jgi:hypothetical protein